MVANATVQAEDAFLAELDRHRKILLKVARLYCSNPHDRPDLVQEMSIQLWHSFARFDGRSQFSTWMYRVALNVAISWTRAQSSRGLNAHSVDARETDLAAADQAPEQLLADRDLLENILATLNELDRALMILHLEGHDHVTIAEVLGVSTSNVATKINRIKDRLQQQFR